MLIKDYANDISLLNGRGTIATPLVAKADSGQGDFDRPAIFKRKGEPEEVAALIGYLLGDESKFITGAAHSIDGGWYC